MILNLLGDLCGAVYLDEEFDKVIRTHVGHSVYDKLSDAAKAKMFENDWEFGAKRKYDGLGPVGDEFRVDIPGYKPKKSGLFGKRPSSTITLTSLVEIALTWGYSDINKILGAISIKYSIQSLEKSWTSRESRWTKLNENAPKDLR
jgi:hypothetical protein